MRLVLKEEVYNVGLPGDVVEVADGYGRNYLVPRGMAIPATDGAMEEAERLTRARKVEEAETLDDAREQAEAIEARTMVIPKRMDEGGHLYGSVSRDDVHQVLHERGHRVDERRIDMKGTFKEIGTYTVPVQVHPQVSAEVTIEIVDVEGRVTTEGEGEDAQVTVDVDEDAVSEAAAAAADAASDGSLTNAEALAEQALQAARQYEEQQKRRAVEEGVAVEDITPEEGPDGDADDEGEPAPTGSDDDS